MPKDKVRDDAEQKMKQRLEHARHEVASVRTSKATPALLDTVRVEAYGTVTPLNQLAMVNAPEPRLLVVQPYDRSLVADIVKAIQSGDLGLNPADDGNVIRIPVPPLTEERRKDLVKLCGKLVEEGRIAIRQVRRDSIDQLKKKKKAGELSEDDERKGEKDMQTLTDRYIGMLDGLLEKKTTEIMEV
jgi:ribosome recycling factor